jgi:zinc protease
VPAELKVFSRARRFELGNGMRVVLLPVDAMPVVAGQLIFDAGDAMAPDRSMLPVAAARLLSQPPGATALAQTGVQMRCGTTLDHTICEAHGMNLYLDVMVEAFERLIKVGWYNQVRVESWQRATGASYQHKRAYQRLEFRHQQLAAIYGADHPYARTAVLTAGEIDQIGRDALGSFRDQHYTAANATLVLVGMFDPRQAEALVRETFGAWGRGRKDAPVPRATSPRTGPVHVGVIGDDEPQLDVAILYPSPPGIAGAQAARMVLAHILDDQMRTIRAKLGATYGTNARRDAHVGASAYFLGGAVDTPRAGEALRAMRAGVDALRSGTDFEAMFVRARRKVVQELLGGSVVSTELAAELGEIAQFGADPGYESTLLRQAAALSPAQVKQLVARELDPSGEVIVLLGGRAAVTRAFADAGITDARLVEPGGPAAGAR